MSSATLASPPNRPAAAGRLEIRPLDAPLGAEVLGLDLSRPLVDDDFG